MYVIYPTMSDNKAISRNQLFRYEEVSWIALVQVDNEDKFEFEVREFIGFTFDYVHYFSKRTLKCLLSVIIQPDYDHEKIVMKLHWYLGENGRIGVIDWNETHWVLRQNLEISTMKDLQKSFAVANGKNVPKQINSKRMMSRIQKGIRAFKAQERNRVTAEEAHVCLQIHQSDVVMRSQKNAKYLSNLKMYFLLLRSFDGKGNVFDDIVSLLPKFKKMGINTLWLSPPQPQTAAGPPMFALNDHGYWPSHHGKIDPVLGGEAAFEHLVQEARWQGIEIAVDTVLNHFGYADLVVLNGKEISTSNPDYFVIIPNIQSTYNHHGELNWKIEGTSNTEEILQYREELSQYPLFDLPTLRKDNPEVRTYLLDSYKKFVDMGVTTFRIDAAKHMPAEFLVDFSNQLSKYSLTRLGRLSKFIWEVYIVNSQSLSVFIQGTLRSLDDPMNTFFYDFPMREEFKRIQDPNYQFGWLVSFVQYREKTRQRLDRLIPLVEDHDNGSPIHNRSIAWMIYALTEFYSQNSTFIYHGSEQAGIRLVDRPRINTINEAGDIGLLVDRLGNCLSPYRNCKETETFFHVTEQDLLVSEKRLPNERSMFLAVSVQKILATHGSDAELDLGSKKVRLRLSPHSFLTIETHPHHLTLTLSPSNPEDSYD
jgi:glycosidase